MTPYWKRRVDGQVFGEWLTVVFGLMIVGLIGFKLLRPQPHDGWDYFGMAVWSFVALSAGWRLFRRRRRGLAREESSVDA